MKMLINSGMSVPLTDYLCRYFLSPKDHKEEPKIASFGIGNSLSAASSHVSVSISETKSLRGRTIKIDVGKLNVSF
jgi:hypothetical protein